MAKEPKLKKYNKKTFVTAALRRASLRWPPRNEALKRARVDRGLYKCAVCKNTFKKTEIHIDHILPIINPALGFIGWDDFIERLFCDVDSFQILCKMDHEVKTMMEDEMRKHWKEVEEEFEEK